MTEEASSSRWWSSSPISYGDWPFAKLAKRHRAGLHQRREADVPSTAEFDRLTDFHDADRFDCGAITIGRSSHASRALAISERLRDTLAHEELQEPESAVEHEWRAATIEACNRLTDLSGMPLFNATPKPGTTRFIAVGAACPASLRPSSPARMRASAGAYTRTPSSCVSAGR